MLQKPFILYTVHEDSDCKILQNIIRFLFVHGIDFRPLNIIDYNYPHYINTYPTIIDYQNGILVGLDKIVKNIERKINKSDIIIKSDLFNKMYPDYRINDCINKLNIVEL